MLVCFPPAAAAAALCLSEVYEATLALPLIHHRCHAFGASSSSCVCLLLCVYRVVTVMLSIDDFVMVVMVVMDRLID